jgi:aspartyl protease family protein
LAVATPEPVRANDAAIAAGVGLGLAIIGGIINSARNQPPAVQQPSYANGAACQSWLAVLNDQRYDAATRAQAQQIVGSCGLPYSGGGGPAPTYAAPVPAYSAPAPAYAAPTNEIALTVASGGGWNINGSVNGVPVRFILDTGATATSIPLNLARALYHQGQLTEANFRGFANFTTATGASNEQAVVTLNTVTIGGQTVHNVVATVAPSGTDLLLGQTFLRHFKSYTIDNARHLLILG